MSKGSWKKFCPDCGLLVDIENHDCPVLRKKRNRQQAIKRRNDESTNKELTSQRWRKFRSRIILMDKGECQRCLVKYHKHNFDDLTVHHIRPRVNFPELMYKEDNCITLCRTCNLTLGLTGIDFDWDSNKRGKIITSL